MKDEIQKIATYDLERKMNWQKPPIDSLYGWYYSTQAMFPKDWTSLKEWNAKFQKLLIKEQHPEGYWIYPGRKHGSMVEEFDEKVSQQHFAVLCLLFITGTSLQPREPSVEKLKQRKKEASNRRGLKPYRINKISIHTTHTKHEKASRQLYLEAFLFAFGSNTPKSFVI